MADIAEILENLKREFLAEIPERIDQIESGLLALEKTANYENEYNDLYRRVHSLKGSAGTYGLPAISTVCHHFEDALAYQHGAQTLVSGVLPYVDLLRKTNSIYEGGSNNFDSINKRLIELQKSLHKNRVRCALVTPSKTTRQMLEQVLSSKGVEATFFSDGYHALGQLLTQKFDLLVCGHELGALSGTALISAIKQSNCPNQTITTIVITSSHQVMKQYKRATDPAVVLGSGINVFASLEQEIDKALESAKE